MTSAPIKAHKVITTFFEILLFIQSPPYRKEFYAYQGKDFSYIN